MRAPSQMIAATAGLALAMSPILVIAQTKAERSAASVLVCSSTTTDCTKGADRRNRVNSVAVGDMIALDRVDDIPNPGIYGLSTAPRGDTYGVMDGHLIRFDTRSGHIKSILRLVDGNLN